MAKHTSGPWKVCNGPDHEASDVILNSFRIEAPMGDEDRYRGSIAMLQSCGHIQGITRKECAANARLIAAAPELLEAIEDRATKSAIESGLGVSEWRAFLNDKEAAAIAKATGETE